LALKLENVDPRYRPFEDRQVPLDKVQIDRSTQARVRLNPEKVKEYVELLDRKVEFKDHVEVYYDGFVYWVGDGFHRLAAYKEAGRAKVPARVREGTHREAMIHAAGANAEHGLPRKREDVRRAIKLLLEDDQVGRYSSRLLAGLARCAPNTVEALKKEMGLDKGPRVYTDRWGNETEMDVSGQQTRKKTFAFNGPVNAFHDLPAPIRGVLKEVLREISQLPKESYSFVLSWLQGHLPPKPKEAGNLLTQLELEEQSQPEGEDLLGPGPDEDDGEE